MVYVVVSTKNRVANLEVSDLLFLELPEIISLVNHVHRLHVSEKFVTV